MNVRTNSSQTIMTLVTSFFILLQSSSRSYSAVLRFEIEPPLRGFDFASRFRRLFFRPSARLPRKRRGSGHQDKSFFIAEQ
ncbi:hypothetical protein H8S23_00880 [Anaerofilum sp. BX8]|uniref:Uncharacterized protein n=1 Tax=Anaerofilum hominis TaxID=2763016 RepID=A0A923L0B1_9FIRM|nr:hypothetical protein [Anaerofilum hominis]MBC5580057.1 hypothetical protein [Anaerofilum hominis]